MTHMKVLASGCLVALALTLPAADAAAQAAPAQAGQPADHVHDHPPAQTPAQTPDGKGQPPATMGAAGGSMSGMMADVERLRGLVAKMNAATGAAKVDAMADVLTALVEQHASMCQHMMGGGMMQQMHGGDHAK